MLFVHSYCKHHLVLFNEEQNSKLYLYNNITESALKVSITLLATIGVSQLISRCVYHTRWLLIVRLLEKPWNKQHLCWSLRRFVSLISKVRKEQYIVRGLKTGRHFLS